MTRAGERRGCEVAVRPPEESITEEIRARAKCLVITSVKRDEKKIFVAFSACV